MTLKSMNEMPSWVNRAEHIRHKPNWIDKVPKQLWELGEVFFPIPRGKKGWSYPHHMDEYRYSPTSEILNAYLESGWGYGIACDNELIVIDVDDLRYLEDIIEKLPETLYQHTGSGEGVHLFYKSEGFNRRKVLGKLVYDHTSDAVDKATEIHIGEIKADPHGYVVGPGSVHPSGNKYGPLKGDKIVEIDKDYVIDSLSGYIHEDRNRSPPPNGADRGEYEDYANMSDSEFYSLSADDVLPWLEPKKRIAHPIHGSDTNSNFMKNEDRETFTCWRCQFGAGGGCGLNAQQYLALEAVGHRFGDYACEKIRSKWPRESILHYYAWRQAAVEGMVSIEDIPYTVAKGFLVSKGVIDEEDEVFNVHDASEQLKYEMQARLRDDVLN